MFKTIIWATDGSEVADGALPFAKELAQCDDGKLVVVHSNEKFSGRASGYSVLADEEELEAKIRLQVEELRTEGFDATFTLVSGASAEAAHSIADVAGREEADVIVVGTRGHRPMAGVLVGSVTQRLLHIAPCPVLAVPAAMQRSEKSTPREHATAAS
jgi:nucleotide-binding universal stress UspA family protein